MAQAEDTCLFCRIVAGAEEASIVYEDALSLAFMDLAQPSRGHALLVPRQHFRDLFDIDNDTAAALIGALGRLARAAREAFSASGVTIWQQNGSPWQEVMHLHFHVLPRYPGDNVMRRPWPLELPETSRDALEAQAALIRRALQAAG